MRQKPDHPVGTTETSFAIIEAIRSSPGARTTELAETVGVAKSTVHKHASTLVYHGYLRKEKGAYYPGLKLLNLGETARTGFPAYSRIEEAVRTLQERTEEDVDFVVEEQGLVYTIFGAYHKWEKRPDTNSGYRARLGDQYYMHSVASGKALLATYDQEEVEGVINRWGLPQVASETITDREALFAALEQIDEQGYAIAHEEYQEGLVSMSRPVRRPDGKLLGALSVSGPAYRLTDDILEGEIAPVHETVVTELHEAVADTFSG
ncbi:IclR family transcriptional regulator [Halodesulfurarchaeum sp.]|uniref:IclR family transcriptional regulator n=1 Tax=Halodesulfurarchaeum sp. TaxID=1980530 RepID=UPI001BC15DB8|nr:IclR family transcriptional regulator [Halodesulfurarchaeum sp.]